MSRWRRNSKLDLGGVIPKPPYPSRSIRTLKDVVYHNETAPSSICGDPNRVADARLRAEKCGLGVSGSCTVRALAEGSLPKRHSPY